MRLFRKYVRFGYLRSALKHCIDNKIEQTRLSKGTKLNKPDCCLNESVAAKGIRIVRRCYLSSKTADLGTKIADPPGAPPAHGRCRSTRRIVEKTTSSLSVNPPTANYTVDKTTTT